MEQVQDSQIPIKVFYSYSHKDQWYRDKLKTHLSAMRRQGFISEWHAQDILPGKVWADEINKHLKNADVILLLISPDFMDSDYCYSTEMQHAIKRCEDGEACIIPIIIRPCEWKYSPLGTFQALPNRAKAVSTWANRDEAFQDIVQGIRRVVASLRKIKAKDKGSSVILASTATIPSTQLKRNRSSKTTKLAQKKLVDRSISRKTQGILNLIINNFSLGEIKKRTRGFFSLSLLFLFTIFNIMVLPYLIYWWTSFLISALSLFLLGFLFLMGITSKNGTAAYSITVVFFIAWILIGFAGINGYYRLGLPLYWLVIIILILSLLQLTLFRPRIRKRRAKRIY